MKTILISLSLLFVSLGATAANPIIRFETTIGHFEVELYPEKAPITVANFLKYVNSNFFDNTLFHRVVKGFVIQGGGFTPDMNEKSTDAPIKNEAGNGLSNLRGTIGMARTQDIDSATSEFFINTKDNLKLDHRDETPAHFGYAVFGKVIFGMDVIDKIEAVETHTVGEFENVPVTPVIVTTAK